MPCNGERPKSYRLSLYEQTWHELRFHLKYTSNPQTGRPIRGMTGITGPDSRLFLCLAGCIYFLHTKNNYNRFIRKSFEG